MAADAPPDLKLFRNIGVIAHIDAGKTTTTEHLLYYSGAKHKLGGVDEGTTSTDYDKEEQERGITIYSACVPLKWKGHTVNLIDTPGHVDFTAEVERSLRVLDGAVVVFDAQKGVEAQSETVWRQADKYRVPRLVFVNKMDVVGANFPNVLDEVAQRLEGRPVALFIPVGSGPPSQSDDPFKGVIDLLEQKAFYFEPKDGKVIRAEEVPEHLLADVKRYREKLFDVLTEADEKDLITSAVLEGAEPDAEKVRQLIREQTIARRIHPVLCGSGREHAGIQPLLDAVCHYLPCPLDRPAVEGANPRKEGAVERRKPDFNEPFCGLVFKVIAVSTGDLFFVRVYSGSLKGNSRVWNPGKDEKELVGKIYHINADPDSPKEDVAVAYAGDIVAVIGLKKSVTGDTLCETQHPILLEPITFVEPVVSRTIEPESSADKQKLADTLAALMREDPTFSVKIDPETGQMLMSGMGTLHLDVKHHKIRDEYRLKVRVGKPRVSYRETLESPRVVEGDCDRQIGATKVFAKLKVDFKNAVSEQPVTVASKLKPNTLPPLLQTAAERGLRGALQSGLFGNPVMNVQATVIDGQFDPQLSTEAAFEAAASDAVNKALADNVTLLEPIMKLEVTVPEEFIGPIQGDLTARRAEIGEIAVRGRLRVMNAEVPLRVMFDYADKVRSLSQGRASATMEPHSYKPAPSEVRRAIEDGVW